MRLQRSSWGFPPVPVPGNGLSAAQSGIISLAVLPVDRAIFT
jgi:hypothetical protein